MHFSVSARRAHLLILNRTASAKEALHVATTRRTSGFEAVFVHDPAWTVIDATRLSEIARTEGGDRREAASTSTTWHVGARSDDAGPPSDRVREPDKASVRVVRVARTEKP